MDDAIRVEIGVAETRPREAGPANLWRPLVVDLDGSLVQTDTTVEAVLASLRRPSALVHALRSLPNGRAAFKARLAAAVPLNPQRLAYNAGLLAYLHEERARGRKIILATGADRATAEAVARHLGLFDAVLASDGHTNLTGTAKLQAIRAALGGEPFTYIGNSRTDLRVWCQAAGAICVNAPRKVVRAAGGVTTVERSFIPERPWPAMLLHAMRPHQWVKNLLVFVPLIAARAIGDVAGWAAAVTVFAAFCCAASGIYLLNDLADLDTDRRHPSKAQRPFASGALPLHIGLIAAPLLILAALALAMMVGALPDLLSYVVLSCLYSLWLKTQPLADVFTLAALYGLRLLAGGVASGYHVSLWLLAFSSFLFLGLALIKRVAELKTLAPDSAAGAAGRGYLASDLPMLQLMGVASSFVASLVLALYVQTELSSAVQGRLTPSWIIVPLVLFWECRMWLATTRGQMRDDPIVFAARDWMCWVVAACCFGVLLLDRLVGT